ncbi:hypothetical protein [Actinomadura oligospora]|uniref:hypothetical protein n=1 Tax=Actinomadura oligospora TaxID=111804 RepID=UPI000478A3AB|nr:hypothetical protein [Actinomadura oligospora]
MLHDHTALHDHAAKALAAALGAATLVTASWPGPARAETRAGSRGSCQASSLDPATARPDPRCTPGALNPDVTQANIHRTVCVAGYTRRIRPPVSYTGALKRRQIREYGYRDTSPSSYEEDHFIPLSLGGAPRDPKNLWPEPGGSPNPKDQVEFKLYKAVCAGQVTLAAAQHAIVKDWTTAGGIVP